MRYGLLHSFVYLVSGAPGLILLQVLGTLNYRKSEQGRQGLYSPGAVGRDKQQAPHLRHQEDSDIFGVAIVVGQIT